MNDLEAYATAQRRAQRLISEEIMALLGRTEAPPLGTPFADLGLDSIMAMTLRDRLERELGISLPPTVVFEHPTLRSLTRELVHRLGTQTTRVTTST
jgi:acyl carrier protein